jgi:hypothetical protein
VQRDQITGEYADEDFDERRSQLYADRYRRGERRERHPNRGGKPDVLNGEIHGGLLRDEVSRRSHWLVESGFHGIRAGELHRRYS